MMSDEKKRALRPFQERPFGDILHSIDAFFQDTVSFLRPPRHIPVYQYETNSHYIIEAELPGVNKEQISLDIYHNFIKISVRSEEIFQESDENNIVVRQNSHFQKSERMIPIPFAINESDVKAHLAKGMLIIQIPNNRKSVQID